MRIFFFLAIFLASYTGVQAQEEALPYKDLKIYNINKTYRYLAIYLDANGDTLSNEYITVESTGKASPLQKSQAVVNYFYNYTAADSAKLASKPINETKFTKKWNTIQWRRMLPEGIIESESQLWIHPFRINQYSLTEIAPFPEAHLPLAEGKTWSNLMFIGKGWGTFSGKARDRYEVATKSTRTYAFGTIDDCWKIDATAEHKKTGNSSISYYYHATYGFVEMNYTFYNGQRILFVLEGVEQK